MKLQPAGYFGFNLRIENEEAASLTLSEYTKINTEALS